MYIYIYVYIYVWKSLRSRPIYKYIYIYIYIYIYACQTSIRSKPFNLIATMSIHVICISISRILFPVLLFQCFRVLAFLFNLFQSFGRSVFLFYYLYVLLVFFSCFQSFQSVCSRSVVRCFCVFSLLLACFRFLFMLSICFNRSAFRFDGCWRIFVVRSPFMFSIGFMGVGTFCCRFLFYVLPF